MIPDYQALMLPVLKIAARQESRVPELARTIADEFGLDDEERERMLPSGRQKLLHNRIHWAKFYMSKAGLLQSPSRGRFTASKAGRDLLAQNPQNISVEMLKGYPAFSDFYDNANRGAAKATAVGATMVFDATPEEQIDAAHSAITSALQTDLLQRVLTQSPAFFERLIIDLLVAMGYGGSHEQAALNLGKSGDGGVDGVVDEDRLGLDRIYVQAKRYAPHLNVSRPEVQAFVGSLVGLGATKGVFVTTSAYSKHATDYARTIPQRVILIDGARFMELLIEHNVGVRTHRVIATKRIDEDFFSEE